MSKTTPNRGHSGVPVKISGTFSAPTAKGESQNALEALLGLLGSELAPRVGVAKRNLEPLLTQLAKVYADGAGAPRSGDFIRNYVNVYVTWSVNTPSVDAKVAAGGGAKRSGPRKSAAARKSRSRSARR